MRVLVTGGRNYADKQSVFAALDSLATVYGQLTIVQGGATGTDALAREWCKARGMTLINEPAQWADLETPPVVKRARRDGSIYNAAAGGIRNQKMIDAHKPELVLAFPGGSGTADMVRRSEAAGVRVLRG